MNSNEIKLVLFDIGSTLMNCDNAFKTAAREQNIPFEAIDKTFDSYDKEITIGKITPQELYIKSIERNSLNADKNYNFMESWLSDYIPIKESIDLLYKLKEKYQIGLFSNIYKGMVQEMIKNGMLPKINYNFLFISCDIGMRKPDKEFYDYVLSKTNLQPNEIFFVDDKAENLTQEVAKGWNTFKFSYKDHTESAKQLSEILLINI